LQIQPSHVFKSRKRAFLGRDTANGNRSVPDVAIHQPGHDLAQIAHIAGILSLKEIIPHGSVELRRFAVWMNFSQKVFGQWNDIFETFAKGG